MSEQVTLMIDGIQVQAPAGTLIVDAAKLIGIDIPVFCYHPKMEPVGMCRMCLVEVGRPLVDRATGKPVLDENGASQIQFGPKLETACTTPVAEGMVVVGMSEKAKAAHKDILEFLLTSHPLDCPICDKGGECPLQNLTMAHGPGMSRFLYDEKKHLAKRVPLGELIYLDRERCIQCARCVRFQDEIVDDPVLSFHNRGRSMEIITNSDPGFDSYFSGNTTDICPVGALTTADFRFSARPWELKATASICSQCPVGCNIVFDVRREARAKGEIVIKRVMPRQNESVNEIWICDKGRFAYHYTESDARLTQPMVRRNGELVPASWDEALDLAAERLQKAGSGVLSLASGRLANEDLFNLADLTEKLEGHQTLYTHMGGGELVGQIGVGAGTNLQELGKGSAILVVASDLEEEAPIWWLRLKQAAERGASLIVANPRATKLDRYASHILRYAYGEETSVVLALVNALSAKRPDLPSKVALTPQIKAAAEVFARAENGVIFYGSEGLGLAGTSALAQACANLLISTDHTGRANNGLVAVWQRVNDQGAWDLGWRPVPDLAQTVKSAGAVLIAGANPAGDSPELQSALVEAAHNGAYVIVQELFLTETARLADVVFPVQAFTEREGTYTSGERRVQRFYPAVLPRSGCLPDHQISAQIGQRLGLDMEGGFAGRVMARLVATVPSFAELGSNPYRRLAEVTQQLPIMGRGDLYYGGTTYENTQGLGLQLTPAAQDGNQPALAWPQPPQFPTAEEELIAVPVTVLYDRGQTVWPSKLLHQRIANPYLVLNPQDAIRMHLRTGENRFGPAVVELSGGEYLVEIHLDQSLPAGLALAPRSFGLPVFEPVRVKLSLAEIVPA
jgi:NADH-quinone oxidoreductase subunit G